VEQKSGRVARAAGGEPAHENKTQRVQERKKKLHRLVDSSLDEGRAAKAVAPTGRKPGGKKKRNEPAEKNW